VDFINGVMVEIAHEYGEPAPENEWIVRRIHEMENERRCGKITASRRVYRSEPRNQEPGKERGMMTPSKTVPEVVAEGPDKAAPRILAPFLSNRPVPPNTTSNVTNSPPADRPDLRQVSPACDVSSAGRRCAEPTTKHMTPETEPVVETVPKQPRNRRGSALPWLLRELERMAEESSTELQELAKQKGDRLRTKAAEARNALRQYDAAMRDEQIKVRAGLNTISGGGVELMARASKEEDIKAVLRRNGWRV
jgi:hypothetical protein